MRRYDLLDECSTLIAPPLAPQARPRLHPPVRTLRWRMPAALVAFGCVLLAAV